MALASFGLFLKVNEELRAATFNPGMRESAVVISSVNPSLKYSMSASPLKLSKGSTATELGGERRFVAAGLCHTSHTTVAPRSAIAAEKAASEAG